MVFKVVERLVKELVVLRVGSGAEANGATGFRAGAGREGGGGAGSREA